MTSGPKYLVRILMKDGSKTEFTLWESQFTSQIMVDDPQLNKAILDCYITLKEMQQDEIKKNRKVIGGLGGAFNGKVVEVSCMNGEIIADIAGWKTEFNDYRDFDSMIKN